MVKSVGKELEEYAKLPLSIFEDIGRDLSLCISSAIADTRKLGERFVSLNIGIGTLSIDTVNNKYKFLPSKELRNTIKDSSSIKLKDLNIDPTIIEKINKQMGK